MEYVIQVSASLLGMILEEGNVMKCKVGKGLPPNTRLKDVNLDLQRNGRVDLIFEDDLFGDRQVFPVEFVSLP